MKKTKRFLFVLGIIFLSIIFVLNFFKFFALKYTVENIQDNTCMLKIEVKDFDWNPFVNNLTVRIPNKIGKNKIVYFGIIGGEETVTKVVIGKNVEWASHWQLEHLKKLRSIKISMFNKNITSVNGAIYTRDKTTLVYWPNNKSVLSLKNRNNLKIIGPYAFSSNENITKIKLPKKIEKIYDCAFGKCENLKVVDLSNCNFLYSIDNDAFFNCLNLEEIKFPNNCLINVINKGTFSSCENLKSIKIPKNVKIIENSAFYNCKSLETIEFEEGSMMEKIEDYAFKGCAFKSISLPNSIISLGEYAFSDNHHLEKIDLSDHLVDIGKGCFMNCVALKIIKIPELIKIIKEDTFKNCSSLIDIKFPAGLKQIDAYAFSECTSLKTIELSNNIRIIGYGCFKGCTNLENVVLSKSLSVMWGEAFSECTSLKEIVLPETLKSISDKIFKNCNNLVKITFGKHIGNVLYYAFDGCNSLTKIVYLGTKEDWDKIVIYDGNTLFEKCEIEYIN